MQQALPLLAEARGCEEAEVRPHAWGGVPKPAMGKGDTASRSNPALTVSSSSPPLHPHFQHPAHQRAALVASTDSLLPHCCPTSAGPHAGGGLQRPHAARHPAHPCQVSRCPHRPVGQGLKGPLFMHPPCACQRTCKALAWPARKLFAGPSWRQHEALHRADCKRLTCTFE